VIRVDLGGGGVYPVHRQGDNFRQLMDRGPGFSQESLAAELHIFREIHRGSVALSGCLYSQG